MNKEGRLQNVLIILLAVAVVGMSVGFAALQTNLTINGNATFEKSKWEVIWANLTEVDTKNQGTVEINNSNMNVDYTVVLKPNSTYKFTVDVVNNGTFDAKLTAITFNGKSPAQVTSQYSPKIGYTFKYDGVAVDTNATPNTTIAPNGRKQVEVELSYPMPEAENMTLNDDLELTLGVQLNFVPVTD